MSPLSRLDVRRDNDAQVAEALGDCNKWVTGEKVGHDPSTRECLEHYIAHGGAADFRRRTQAKKLPASGGGDDQG